METIRRQVSKARRLLWTQTLFNVLAWNLILAFTICFFALLVPKIWYLEYTYLTWSRNWLISSGVLAACISLGIAWFYRPNRLTSAIEIDRRFGLRERCSSALNLNSEELETPIGQALVQDAQAKIERIDVRDQFPIRPAPQTAWVALPFAACIALFWVPDATPIETSIAKGKKSDNITNVKKDVVRIADEIRKKREAAESDGDEESAEQFKKIEDKLNTIKNDSEIDKKKLIADLNEIKKELQQRRESLGGADAMKKAMESVKNLDKGPAEKLAKALEEGDFDKAGKELEKMLDQMESGKMSAEQTQQLQKQLDQMSKAMEKAKAKVEELKAEAKKELDKAEKEGNVEKAAAIRKKLDQLGNGEKQAKMLEKVQGQMAKAKEALEKGDKQGAAQALGELKDAMEDMGADQMDANELEEMMEEFEDAKNASKCDACDGQGCEACKGKDGKGGQKGQKGQKGKGQGKEKGEGDGDGEGKGEGDRDEKEADYKNFDAQVRDEMRKGETINGGKVAGKNRKGTTSEEAKQAVLSAKQEDPDAIENMNLPKAQRDQQREYFDSLRGQR